MFNTADISNSCRVQMNQFSKKQHYIKRLSWAAFSIALLFLCNIATASPVVITQTTGSYIIGKRLSVLEDPSGQLSIKDIISDPYIQKFLPIKSDTANFGYSDSAYWFRFELENADNSYRNLLLEIGYPLLDDIHFYALTDKNVHSEKHSGDLQPFEQRDVRYQNVMFSVTLKPRQKETIFLRVKTKSSVQVPLTLWDPLAFAEHINGKQLGLGVYYGSMLVMVFYNLFLFFSIRDRVYLFYVTYIASFILTQMALDGLAFEYLWPESPTIANKGISFLVLMVNLAAAFFWRSFLNIKTRAPRLYTIANGIIFFAFVGIISTFFLTYSITIRYAIAVTIVNSLMGISTGIYCWRLKVPTATYYVMAWLIFLVGSIIKSLTVLGILPTVFITDYAQQIGSSIEVILLSLGLADRINHLKRDSRDKQERYLQLKLKSTEEENASRQAMLVTQAESNKLKDAFLTTISHELRTPMNGVLGAMELMKTHDLDGKLREDIEIAEMSAERMISLVDRVLDFSQTQSGMSEVANRPFDMHQALQITCQSFALECKQREIQLAINFDDLRHKIVTGDMDKIVSIVRLILDNAVKFSDKHDIQCRATINESQQIEISIVNHGIGIDPELYDTIFEPFHQIDASFHRSHGGLGIGLSTAKALATLLETEIKVKSDQTSGTTFSFTLDLPIENKCPDQVNAHVHSTKVQQSPANLLIVEDNKVNQIVLKKMVTSLGYSTTEVENGQEAVDFIEKNHIDLILMDCQMPIMNGFDATKAIREGGGPNKDIPIIAVTANVTDQDKKKAFQSGMNDLVAKPVNLKLIQASIETWLTR